MSADRVCSLIAKVAVVTDKSSRQTTPPIIKTLRPLRSGDNVRSASNTKFTASNLLPTHYNCDAFKWNARFSRSQRIRKCWFHFLIQSKRSLFNFGSRYWCASEYFQRYFDFDVSLIALLIYSVLCVPGMRTRDLLRFQIASRSSPGFQQNDIAGFFYDLLWKIVCNLQSCVYMTVYIIVCVYVYVCMCVYVCEKLLIGLYSVIVPTPLIV